MPWRAPDPQAPCRRRQRPARTSRPVQSPALSSPGAKRPACRRTPGRRRRSGPVRPGWFACTPDDRKLLLRGSIFSNRGCPSCQGCSRTRFTVRNDMPARCRAVSWGIAAGSTHMEFRVPPSASRNPAAANHDLDDYIKSRSCVTCIQRKWRMKTDCVPWATDDGSSVILCCIAAFLRISDRLPSIESNTDSDNVGGVGISKALPTLAAGTISQKS